MSKRKKRLPANVYIGIDHKIGTSGRKWLESIRARSQAAGDARQVERVEIVFALLEIGDVDTALYYALVIGVFDGIRGTPRRLSKLESTWAESDLLVDQVKQEVADKLQRFPHYGKRLAEEEAAKKIGKSASTVRHHKRHFGQS